MEAESATDDKKSRHERCRIAHESDEGGDESGIKRTTVKQSRTVPPLPPVPVGLRSAVLPSASKRMQLSMYCRELYGMAENVGEIL